MSTTNKSVNQLIDQQEIEVDSHLSNKNPLSVCLCIAIAHICHTTESLN